MNLNTQLKFNTPTIIVIFGATGNLNQKRLMPALFGLARKKALPDKFKIIGFANQSGGDKYFKKFVWQAVGKDSAAERFSRETVYHKGAFDEFKNYQQLKVELEKIDNAWGQCSNKLFYLAVAPAFLPIIFKNLAESELTRPCSEVVGWTRVLVEKPFGQDIATAKKLDSLLAKWFKEKQIFRIDHYLAKETIQNILTFRFSNSIFEPVWNNKFIEKVEIKLLEQAGVGERGLFYDGVGALRDVGQSHVLQMLALVAMNNPKKMDAKLIRQERAKVMKDLHCLSKKELSNSVVKGQYLGYKKTAGVKPDSTTETYFKLKTFVDNSRWRGVPFILESGKGLKENRVEIKIYFKSMAECFCPENSCERDHQNILIFQIQPQEGIMIRFFAKHPGLLFSIGPKDLSFDYRAGEMALFNPYEKVLFDCITGDQTLFASTDEIDASWKFITPILNGWNRLKLIEYEEGKV